MDFPAALESAQVWMEEVAGVAAVGECESDGEKCIYVYVTLPEAVGRLPTEFHGYKVIIQQGDAIGAQQGR